MVVLFTVDAVGPFEVTARVASMVSTDLTSTSFEAFIVASSLEVVIADVKGHQALLA